MFRKSILVLLAAVVSLTAGCTTRYQDMLRDRDERIRELSADIARLRNENDELQRRGDLPAPAEAALPREQSPTVLNQIQDEVGGDASVSYRRGRISIGVEDSVTFDSGSTKLKTSASRVLDNVAGVLKSRFAGHRFYIEGHTDSDPIRKTKDRFRSNRHLSAERADAVATYLIEHGVPEANIVVVGYGPHDPRDPRSKAKNRRVEIVVGDSM